MEYCMSCGNHSYGTGIHPDLRPRGNSAAGSHSRGKPVRDQRITDIHGTDRSHQIRSDALLEYMATRVYRVSDPKEMVHAHEQGRMEFHAPDTKSFVITSEQGSGLVRRLVLNPLMVSRSGQPRKRGVTIARISHFGSTERSSRGNISRSMHSG